MNPARRTTVTATTATALVLATTGALLSTTAPTASAAPVTCASPVYTRQFFANTNFSGTPRKTDCDAAIAENWGANAPATGLPRDNFGVRWSVTRDFGSGGPFALTASGTDGIRVYLDNSREINLWSDTTGSHSRTVNVTIPRGKHTLRVDYVNRTGAAKVKVGYSPRISASADKVKPLAPTNVVGIYVPDGRDNSYTDLAWSANKEMDLAGYRVYRRLQGTGTWTKVATAPATKLTAWDQPPPTGQSYFYEIRAYDKAGNESAGSVDQGITTYDWIAPAPAVLTATAVEASNNLTWTAPADAVRYRVYRKAESEPDTSYTRIAETTARNYADTEAEYGAAYDYEVDALDAARNARSSNVVRSTRSILPPQDVTATVTDDGVVFTWTEAPGGDTTAYNVYRSTTSPVDTTDEEPITCSARKTRTDAAGDKIRTCVDYKGDRGTTYHYVMVRKNTAGRWSTGSAEMTVTRPGDEVPPPPVTNLTAAPLEYGFKLDWDDSPAADLKEYTVWEYFSCCTPDFLGTVPAGTSEFVVGPEAANGGSHTYVVIPSDIYYNHADVPDGPLDNSVSAVTATELDLRPTTVPEDTAPCSLTTYTALGHEGGMYIDCPDSVATKAVGINVYRWDRATSTYVRVTDVPLRPTVTSYTDRTVPHGTTVYYLLSVVAADGSETFSNVGSSVSMPNGT
ncbi:fibronectin type III domain-containing protein [Streptomyces graminilatus]|uniref:fibronectin type III domain-containing protein n=1 Tax=Streptomyces graminilatus TaxID=1464070 RepID=UPI0006E12364|nr:PA14 domain-containing protein [Streptomyces graminilatus]